MGSELKPAGKFHGFHHIKFWVGNAKQAATYYITRFGFKAVGYRGLETGDREVASHVVQQNNVFFIFESPLNPVNCQRSEHQSKHGDGVRDVAFAVDNCRAIFERAVSKGAKVIKDPWEESDENGTVVMATIATYGDTVHTLVESKNYKGFLPHFRPIKNEDAIQSLLPPTLLNFVDHVVGNQPDLKMESACKMYEEQLDFKRFWSVDDTQIHTEYSSLRSIVMTDEDEKVKMPINEPAPGKKKSQIQEYVDYYGDAGVQHIAMNTNDIIKAVSALKARGVEFLDIPPVYYELLKKKLANASIKVTESMDMLEKLHILIDYDENGYLLQIFTKPVEDRPTLFYEIIQRHNHSGFGAGNFKALFESLELEQERRGNL